MSGDRSRRRNSLYTLTTIMFFKTLFKLFTSGQLLEVVEFIKKSLIYCSELIYINLY